jgi:hypothetical protein
MNLFLRAAGGASIVFLALAQSIFVEAAAFMIFYCLGLSTCFMFLPSPRAVWRVVSAFALFFVLYTPLVSLIIYDCGTMHLCTPYSASIVVPYWALMTGWLMVYDANTAPFVRGTDAESKTLLPPV